MKTLPAVVVASVAVSLCACASLPNAKINYYLARTDMNIQVDRTVACTASGHLVEVFKVTPTPTPSADLTQPQTLEMKSLKGAFSDATFAVGLYDDGRLKSVNGGTTGQGEAALKAAVTVAGAVATMAATGPTESPDKALCAEIKDAADPAKTVTLSYETDLHFVGNVGSPTDVKLSPDSESYEDIAAQLQPVVASWSLVPCSAGSTNSGEPASAVDKCPAPVLPDTSDRAKGVDVKLRSARIVEVKVVATRKNRLLWTGTVPVGQLGEPYDVYLPKAAAFGDTTTILAVNEYGALTSVQYTTKSGTAAALSVIDSAASARQSIADQELQKIKTKADTLAAQQRLAICLADPTNCK